MSDDSKNSPPEDKDFLVWHDPALSEVLCIEKELLGLDFLQQLARENIHPVHIKAPDLHRANEMFLEAYELIQTHQNQPNQLKNQPPSQTLQDSAPEDQPLQNKKLQDKKLQELATKLDSAELENWMDEMSQNKNKAQSPTRPTLH